MFQIFMFESVWKGFRSYSGIYFILFLKCTGSFNLAYGYFMNQALEEREGDQLISMVYKSWDKLW